MTAGVSAAIKKYRTYKFKLCTQPNGKLSKNSSLVLCSQDDYVNV